MTDPQELIEQVERDILHAEERAASASLLVAKLEAINVAGESPDGEVSVRVDASGRLISIELDEKASRVSMPELQRLIMSTITATQRRAARAAVDLTDEAFGPGLSAQLRSDYESRMGTLEEPEDDGKQER